MEVDLATMVVLILWFGFVIIMMLVLWIRGRGSRSSTLPEYKSDTIESSKPLVGITDKELCRRFFRMIDKPEFKVNAGGRMDDFTKMKPTQKRWDMCRTDPRVSEQLEYADEKGCLDSRDYVEYVNCLVPS